MKKLRTVSAEEVEKLNPSVPDSGKTVEEMTREVLGDEYGKFVWAENKLFARANEIVAETGHKLLDALSDAETEMPGVARIYKNGIETFQNRKAGA